MPHAARFTTQNHRLPIKNSVFIVVVGLIVVGLIAGLSIGLASRDCNLGYHDDENISINDQTMRLEIADTSKELTKGLSGRSCIGDNQAMLFIFAKPAQYAFWMKGMKFPIDMVWIDSEHHVVQIDANVTPDTYPRNFIADQPIQYVMEMKVGRAGQLGLQPGQTINF